MLDYVIIIAILLFIGVLVYMTVMALFWIYDKLSSRSAEKRTRQEAEQILSEAEKLLRDHEQRKEKFLRDQKLREEELLRNLKQQYEERQRDLTQEKESIN